MPEQATKPAMAPRAPTDSSESLVHEEIAALAYSLWQGRGCPGGTPDEDWFKAEEALKANAEAEA